MVAAVMPDGAAARAGVKIGDIILSVNGQPVTEKSKTSTLIAPTKVGQKVAVLIKRGNQAAYVGIVIAARPTEEAIAANIAPSGGVADLARNHKIGSAVTQLPGAVWVDQNSDGQADGYVYNGRVFDGAPHQAPIDADMAVSSDASRISETSVGNLPLDLKSGPRLALVIGNSAYAASMGQLPNPANDAGAMSQALGALGFQVTLLRNADQKSMRRAISDFGRRLAKAGPGSTGLFFYAGHGIQAKGINYLIPTDANIQTQADVEMEAVGADAVLEQMEEARASTNIVILDACRNMPLVRGFRSPTRGLAPMDAPNGSFIAYSTAPGSVAADGVGANSPFVTALVKNLRRKGESIESIFRDVRREVLVTTEGTQTPWDSSSLVQPFYFAGR